MNNVRQPQGLPISFGAEEPRSVGSASPEKLAAPADAADEQTGIDSDEKETFASETDKEAQASQGGGRAIGEKRAEDTELPEFTEMVRDEEGKQKEGLEELVEELNLEPAQGTDLQRIPKMVGTEKKKQTASLDIFAGPAPPFERLDPIVQNPKGRSIYSIGRGEEKESSPEQKALDALGRLDSTSKSNILVWDQVNKEWRKPGLGKCCSIGRLVPTVDGGSLHRSTSARVALTMPLTYYPRPPQDLERIGISRDAEVLIKHEEGRITDVEQTKHDLQQCRTQARSHEAPSLIRPVFIR